MPEWARSVLKWTVAVAAMVLVVVIAVPRIFDELSEAVTFGEQEPELDAELTPEAGETFTEEAHATGSVRVREGTVANVGLHTSSLPPQHDILLAFEPPPADPACLSEVQLEVVLDEVSGEPEVLARPAFIESFEALAVEEPLPADAILDTDAPATGQAAPDSETLRWTVTDPYAVSAREAPADGSVVLALSLAPDSEGELTIGTAAGPAEVAPTIIYTILEDCPDADEPAET